MAYPNLRPQPWMGTVTLTRFLRYNWTITSQPAKIDVDYEP